MRRYILFFLLYFPPNIESQIKIDTLFEGANAKILFIDAAANSITIEPQRRYKDNTKVTFALKITGFDVGIPFTVRVKNGNIGYLPILAAYSYDRVSWSRISGTAYPDGKEYSALFAKTPLYFATGFPYLYSDILSLTALFAENPNVEVTNATISEYSNAVKLFRFSDASVLDSGKYLLWVTGRNHAMESHSSYVVDGLMRFLASPHPQAVRLRKQAIVFIAPMMDVDQVIAGGTGKDQSPVDFNRDWDSPSYWNAINGVKQAIIQSASMNRMTIFIDSHNPFPGQNDNNTWFYSGYASGTKSTNLDLFRKLYQKNSGVAINREAMYSTIGQTAAFWVDSMFHNIDFSTSLETGWVGRTDNIEWTIPLYQEHGANLGKAMSDYISNIVKPGDIILDNTDTTGSVLISGSWISSSSISGFYGANYLHDNNNGKGLKSVLYAPNISVEGDYEIFMMWSADPGRANNVPVTITFNGGIHDTVVNQQLRGGEWVSLGIYRLAAGTSGNVLLGNNGTTSYVVADAFRFSRVRQTTPSAVRHESHAIPIALKLDQNFPNPFNPTTTISYALPKAGHIILKVYDVLGKEIATLVNDYKESGHYQVNFETSKLSSGMYVYKLTSGNFTQIKKMMLLK